MSKQHSKQKKKSLTRSQFHLQYGDERKKNWKKKQLWRQRVKKKSHNFRSTSKYHFNANTIECVWKLCCCCCLVVPFRCVSQYTEITTTHLIHTHRCAEWVGNFGTSSRRQWNCVTLAISSWSLRLFHSSISRFVSFFLSSERQSLLALFLIYTNVCCFALQNSVAHTQETALCFFADKNKSKNVNFSAGMRKIRKHLLSSLKWWFWLDAFYFPFFSLPLLPNEHNMRKTKTHSE